MRGPTDEEYKEFAKKKREEDLRSGFINPQLPIDDQVEQLVARKFFWKPFIPTEANFEAIKKFREILKETLTQVWDGMKEELKKIESIKLIFTSFACPVDCIHVHRPAKEGMCDLGLWQMIFHGSLIEPLKNGSPQWTEYVKFQIAHQIARFHLQKNELSGEDGETSANNLARLWGFVTIEPTDPEAPVTAWDMLMEAKPPEENLDECLQRLIDGGMVSKFRQPEKSRKGKK